MDRKLLLGIDVGTTGTKSIVIDTDGTILGRAYAGYEIYHDQVGYAEQNVDDLWNAVVHTVREITKNPEIRKDVVSISLSTQGGTLIPVDENGRPLYRAIVWTDSRCANEYEDFIKTCSPQQVYDKTGWNLGNGLNALEIMWLKKNRPKIFQKTDKFLSVPDYIAFKLTGRYAIDLSNAGINQLANIIDKCWDSKILETVGITKDKLPELKESGDVIGTLCRDAIAELGLSKDVMVVAGGHDQYCVALGAGALKNGDVFIATGTAWVVTGIFDKPNFDYSLRIAQSRHTVKDMWGSLISLGTGGVCLEWFRKNMNIIGENKKDIISFQELDREVEKKQIGANGLLFYPYFAGVSYPEHNNSSKAVMIGMDLSHDRFNIARAIMEGVAFQIVWTLEAFKTSDIKELKLVGGASNSRTWVQMVADIADMPIIIPEIPDMACIGAAVLAGMGAGVFENAEEGHRKLATSERRILPIPENAGKYQEIFSHYKSSHYHIVDC